MSLRDTDPNGEAAITLWAVGWLSSFPALLLAENDVAWMAAAGVSLALVSAGLRQARLVASRRDLRLSRSAE